MSELCLDDCGSHGFCNESAQACVCVPPFANLGDYVARPNLLCDVNFEVNKQLWIAAVVLHFPLASLLVASLCFLRRGTKRRAQGEVFNLVNLLIGEVCAIIVGILEATATVPGGRSIGVDLLTTCFYCASEISVTMHAVFLPFVQSGTSLLPFALMSNATFSRYLRSIRVFYGILFCLILLAHLFVLGIVFDPLSAESYIHASFSCMFVVVLTSGLFTFVAIEGLLRKIRSLKNSQGHELSSAQKGGMEITRKRASGTRLISLIVIFLYSPQFLLFAVSPTTLFRAAWIWVPVRNLFVCLFDYRHPYLSLTTSYSHYKAGNDDESAKVITPNAAEVHSTSPEQPQEMKTFTRFPKSRQKKKWLTRVEEERTVDIRTEMATDTPSY